MASPGRIRVTDVPPVVAKLAAHAKIEPRMLALLSSHTLRELCQAAGFELLDRIAVETYAAKVQGEKLSVGEVAERAEEQKLYP